MIRIMIVFLKIIWLSGVLAASHDTGIDSLLQIRKDAHDRYLSFIGNMKERSWVNLVALQVRAGEVISVDNVLIEKMLKREQQQYHSFETQREELEQRLEKLDHEINILELEKKYLYDRNRMVMVATGVLLLLFLVFLILYIAAHLKQSKLRMLHDHLVHRNSELEKELGEATSRLKEAGEREQEHNRCREEIMALTSEMKHLKEHSAELEQRVSAQRGALQEETRSRELMEEHIRSLITRLKQSL
ncbi:MAG: hypothetical protein JW861_10835 [Bacteroidales bacterium]|nr:hypothetical protein [Bacteroidales bacterium]